MRLLRCQPCEIASDRKSVDLMPGDRESVLDRDFDMFVPCVVNRRTVDDDIFVRWYRQPNMNLDPVPWRCFWLGAIMDTRHPVMR